MSKNQTFDQKYYKVEDKIKNQGFKVNEKLFNP